jgi:hypothetical protein
MFIYCCYKTHSSISGLLASLKASTEKAITALYPLPICPSAVALTFKSTKSPSTHKCNDVSFNFHHFPLQLSADTRRRGRRRRCEAHSTGILARGQTKVSRPISRVVSLCSCYGKPAAVLVFFVFFVFLKLISPALYDLMPRRALSGTPACSCLYTRPVSWFYSCCFRSYFDPFAPS